MSGTGADQGVRAQPGSRRRLILLLAVFALSRALNGWVATQPIEPALIQDVRIYEGWGSQILDGGQSPYAELDVEYPPAALPFVVGPEALDGDPLGYRDLFVVTMLLVDLAGLLGLLRLSRRWGSPLGPWLWVLGPMLLGPLIYLRLDLVPAAATIWAIERAAAGSWGGFGGWLGFGAAAKIYPALLLPLGLVYSRRPRRTLMGFGLLVLLGVLPFVGNIGDLWRDVMGYHGARGIQIESTWGLASLIAQRFGYDVSVTFSFGAMQAQSGLVPLLKALGLLLSLGALVGGSWFAARVVRSRVPASNRDGATPMMAAAMFGTLSLVMSFGTVFSPQFVIWPIALGSAALCYRSEALRPVLLMLPVAAMTQVLFPFLGSELVAGETPALLALLARNLLVFLAGFAALRNLPAISLPDETEATQSVPELQPAGGSVT